MWRLIGLSAVMLVTGFYEAVFTDQALWGAISNATYVCLLYLVGSAKSYDTKHLI
jgi:hypothetical protein